MTVANNNSNRDNDKQTLINHKNGLPADTIWDMVAENAKVILVAFVFFCIFLFVFYANSHSYVLEKNGFGYSVIIAIMTSILIAVIIVLSERTFEKKSIIDRITAIISSARDDIKSDVQNILKLQ